MRILISNDDGIHAHGLKVLEKVALQLSDDIWVVAPESEQSGAGHSLTINNPLRICAISERRFAITGTPTDAVLIGASYILRHHPPDLVLSGINYGGNLAEDITYSGTVAVAMEATLLGIKAIACSLVVGVDRRAKWNTVEQHAPALLEQLMLVDLPPKVFLNVNFPDVKAASVRGVRATAQGQRPIREKLMERIDPRGLPYYWITGINPNQSGPAGTDLEAVVNGYVSVTPLNLDFTHQSSLAILSKVSMTGE